MKNKNLLTKRIIFIVLIAIILSGISFVNGKLVDSTNKYEYIKLDSNWDIVINDVINNNVTLSKLTFPTTQKGDSITLTTVLPDKFVSHPVLDFRLYHCIVEVYIDDECIYEYGKEIAANNDAVGNGRNVVILPEDYMNKKLRLEITVDEDNAFPNIEAMSIQNEINYVSYQVRNYAIEFLLGIFLIDLGIVAVVIIIARGRFSRENRKLIWIGIIALGAGAWILCNYNIAQLFIESRNTITYYEYLGLYFTVPAAVLFYSESNRSIRARRIAMVLISYDMIFNLVTIVLNKINRSHFSDFLSYFHIYAGVVIVFSIVYMFNGYHEKVKSERILTTGIVLLAVIGGIEIIKFNLVKYVFLGTTGNLNFLPVAVMVFIVVMMISYMEYLKEYIGASVEKKVLVDLAYNDMLTGLYNRARCEMVMDEITEKGEREYALINMDLNDLKYINDTMGHMKGDYYICQFADILNYSFGDEASVGRMGGDEFIAIIVKSNKDDIVKTIVNMLELAASNKDDKGRDFPVSFAYGYVVSTKDNPIDIKKAYEIADERMYECKQKQKAERG